MDESIVVNDATGVGEIKDPKTYFKKLTDDLGLVNIIGLLHPPRYGMMLFTTKLEYGVFHPDTELNDQFLFHINPLGDLKLIHIAFPKQYFEVAKAFALECDLRFVNSRIQILGPTVFCSKEILKGATPYPYFNPANSYSLENIPGSKIYTASLEEQHKMIQEERRMCEDIHARLIKVEIPHIH